MSFSSHYHDSTDEVQDLELLASEDREDAIQDAIQEARLGLPRSTPLQAFRQPNTQPPQFSRFFDREFPGSSALIALELTCNSKLEYYAIPW